MGTRCVQAAAHRCNASYASDGQVAGCAILEPHEEAIATPSPTSSVVHASVGQAVGTALTVPHGEAEKVTSFQGGSALRYHGGYQGSASCGNEPRVSGARKLAG